MAADNSVGGGTNLPAASHAQSEKIWAKGMENLVPPGLPDGQKYHKLHALLLSWNDACDDLKVGGEVNELESVLTSDYDFTVHNERLHIEASPQLQASYHVSNFVMHNDNERTLLVIYYAGHGWYNHQTAPGDIKLAGNITPREATKAQEQLQRKSFVWGSVESAICDTKADVLLIFDCCFAGRLCRPMLRSVPIRRYEVLAACSDGQMTRSGGEGSFTSALIWALREYAQEKKPFSTAQLRIKIIYHKPFPDDQMPMLADRLDSCLTQIVLRPQGCKEEPEDEKEAARSDGIALLRPHAESVDLRFYFDSVVTEDGLRKIAESLRRLIEHNDEFPARYVAFRGINTRENTVHKAVTAFQNSLNRKRKSPASAQNAILTPESISLLDETAFDPETPISQVVPSSVDNSVRLRPAPPEIRIVPVTDGRPADQLDGNGLRSTASARGSKHIYPAIMGIGCALISIVFHEAARWFLWERAGPCPISGALQMQ